MGEKDKKEEKKWAADIISNFAIFCNIASNCLLFVKNKLQCDSVD